MSGAASHTSEALAGTLYVYRDEDHSAMGIARWRIGPRGGMTADIIARLANPGKHVRQKELEAYALKFAAAEDLYEALGGLVARATMLPASPENGDAIARAESALSRAKGQS